MFFTKISKPQYLNREERKTIQCSISIIESEKKLTPMSEVAIRSIFDLFDKWGHENYIGENVTQLQHSQQVKTLR